MTWQLISVFCHILHVGTFLEDDLCVHFNCVLTLFLFVNWQVWECTQVWVVLPLLLCKSIGCIELLLGCLWEYWFEEIISLLNVLHDLQSHRSCFKYIYTSFVSGNEAAKAYLNLTFVVCAAPYLLLLVSCNRSPNCVQGKVSCVSAQEIMIARSIF